MADVYADALAARRARPHTQRFDSYFENALFHLPDVIDAAKKRLARIKFDTLVGTGFSGAVVVPALALAMDKKFVLVRKENDDSHHGRGRLLGELGERWLFVDDFISSGRTRAYVIRKIERATDREDTRCVGQYLYKPQYGEKEFARYNPLWEW